MPEKDPLLPYAGAPKRVLRRRPSCYHCGKTRAVTDLEHLPTHDEGRQYRCAVDVQECRRNPLPGEQPICPPGFTGWRRGQGLEPYDDRPGPKAVDYRILKAEFKAELYYPIDGDLYGVLVGDLEGNFAVRFTHFSPLHTHETCVQ
jgi:hypothetical protein